METNKTQKVIDGIKLIFNESEFNRFAQLVSDVIKRDYDIASCNGDVKITPKKKKNR